MEYRWSIYGGRREKQRSFLQGISSVLGGKNLKRENKIPTPPKDSQGINGDVGKIEDINND